MKSLYDILGISRDANQKEIRRAYHKMALKYHPDKQEKRTDEATNLFLQIVDAFTVLSNETLRSDYDKNLELQEATENYRNQISKEANFFEYSKQPFFSLFRCQIPRDR